MIPNLREIIIVSIRHRQERYWDSGLCPHVENLANTITDRVYKEVSKNPVRTKKYHIVGNVIDYKTNPTIEVIVEVFQQIEKELGVN